MQLVRYTSKVIILIHAALFAVCIVLAGCEDDPIIGPTDKDPGGGSYGVIHFEQPGDAPQVEDFLKDNPRRF